MSGRLRWEMGRRLAVDLIWGLVWNCVYLGLSLFTFLHSLTFWVNFRLGGLIGLYINVDKFSCCGCA